MSGPGRGSAGEVRGRLTARDRWLLAMLAEHTVLTTPQLARLGWAPSTRRVQRRALVLHRAQVVDRFRPLVARGLGSAPWYWLLGPRGAAALAAEHGLTVAQIGYRGRARTHAVADRATLGHDVAAHDLITTLAATPGVELAHWWSAARCARSFGHVRPDAYLCLTTHAPDGTRGWWEAFLEYDTGTESLSRLARKLGGYTELAAASGLVTPVAVWIARPGREPSARQALARVLAALPHPQTVPVLTATPASPPESAGGRVWLPVTPPGHHTRRVSIVELAARQPLPTTTTTAGTTATAAAAVGEPTQGRSRDTSALPPPPPTPPAPDAP